MRTGRAAFAAGLVCAALTGGCTHGALPIAAPASWMEGPRWPSAPLPARIVRIGELRSSRDLVRRRGFLALTADLLVGREAEIRLVRPVAIALDEVRQRLIVADPGLPAVVIFDVRRGRAQVVTSGGEGALVSPVGVAVDAAGRIYASDSATGLVSVFAPGGEPLGSLGSGLFERPTGLAIDARTDRLVVVDTQRHVVHALDPATGQGLELGGRGEAGGQLNYPLFAAVGPSGDYFISDALNARVQRFGADGEPLGIIGGRGDSPGWFSHPKGLAFDSDGHLLVVDGHFDNIQVFDPAGKLLLFFGSSGEGPSEFSLPQGIAIDAQDRIFVADSLNGRIQIFAYLSEPWHGS